MVFLWRFDIDNEQRKVICIVLFAKRQIVDGYRHINWI